MNFIKKGYNYLFYKFYRFFESNEFSAWWSEGKAIAIIIILEGFIYFFLALYIIIFINRTLDLLPSKTVVVTIALFFSVLNYYLFMYQDKWKAIVKELDKLPKKKNKVGSWLVFFFVCLVLGNLIYAFYLTSQVDWSQYR